MDSALEEAKHKNIILKGLQTKPSKQYRDFDVQLNFLKDLPIRKIRYYIEELIKDGYVTESQRRKLLINYNHRADRFLEAGGYEAEYSKTIKNDELNTKQLVLDQVKMNLEIQALKDGIKTNKWNRRIAIIALVVSIVSIIISILI